MESNSPGNQLTQYWAGYLLSAPPALLSPLLDSSVFQDADRSFIHRFCALRPGEMGYEGPQRGDLREGGE